MEIERQQPGGRYQVTGDTSPGSIILTAPELRDLFDWCLRLMTQLEQEAAIMAPAPDREPYNARSEYTKQDWLACMAVKQQKFHKLSTFCSSRLNSPRVDTFATNSCIALTSSRICSSL